jgi:hypothetical protein
MPACDSLYRLLKMVPKSAEKNKGEDFEKLGKRGEG